MFNGLRFKNKDMKLLKSLQDRRFCPSGRCPQQTIDFATFEVVQWIGHRAVFTTAAAEKIRIYY